MPLYAAWATSDVKAWARIMQGIGNNAFPRIVAHTLNVPAKAIERDAVRNVRSDLIVRTSYTTNSIKQDRHAKGTNINRMYSRVRTVSPYLPFQDEGGLVAALHGRLPIPVLNARSGNIRQAIRPKYRMNNMGSFANSKRFFLGKPKGNKFKTAGIWERRKGNSQIFLIRSLRFSQVRVPASQWWSSPLRRHGTAQAVGRGFVRFAEREFQRAIRGVS